MTDEELCKALRNFDDGATPTHEAADHIEQLGKACAEWAEVSQKNFQRAKAAEAKLEKVLNHIRKMQGYVQEYLEPGPYVVKHGNGRTLHEPHPHQDEAYAYFMRQQMREAVLNDLIHMLDGPEERATLAEIEGEKE
jgi:hypothetical protein